MEEGIVNLVIFFGFFLTLIGLIQYMCKKTSFPYTIALLLVGFFSQFLVKLMGSEVTMTLTSDMIFYILLPLLLFESAFHINFHQFKLQFKTITFLSTFGLFVSLFTVAYVIALGIGLPIEVALLFGAIISATDPIAVLAMFKELGGPKRLALIADGESMFNDATGVIAFKIVSSFVIAQQFFERGQLVDGSLQFIYVFVGSMIVGGLLGYITARIIEKIKNDRIIETTLTLSLALVSFVVAEHFFHLSGVISTVMAGITLGNIGKTKISSNVIDFIHEFWEYLGFVSLSLVFFFASFNINLVDLLLRPYEMLVVIAAALIGRAVSVYLSFFLSNNLFIFKDEPNVPLRWQHILNWGGMRGVIPLVLAYGIDDSYQYKDLLLSYTLITLLFTLFVNGLTIKWLLKKLGLHLPAKEEEITELENKIFKIEQTRHHLHMLTKEELLDEIVSEGDKRLEEKEKICRDKLIELSDSPDFLKCLNLQSIEIERNSIKKLFEEGYINENVLNDFEVELDLQQDAIEYPDVYKGRGYDKGGILDSSRSFRRRLSRISLLLKEYRFLRRILKPSKDKAIEERYSLLKARIIAGREVISFFREVEKKFEAASVGAKKDIHHVIEVHENLIVRNQQKIKNLNKNYQAVIESYQKNLINSLLQKDSNESTHIHLH